MSVPEKVRDALRARFNAFLDLHLEAIFERGRHAGYQEKLRDSNIPVCECQSWEDARRLGIIRKTIGGYALIGWRGVAERLGEPDWKAVNESLFRWCPWCGAKARSV